MKQLEALILSLTMFRLLNLKIKCEFLWFEFD